MKTSKLGNIIKTNMTTILARKWPTYDYKKKGLVDKTNC